MRMKARGCVIVSLLTFLIIALLAAIRKLCYNYPMPSSNINTVYNASQLTIGYTECRQLMLYLANTHTIDTQPATTHRHTVTLVSLAVTQTHIGTTLAMLRLRDDVDQGQGHAQTPDRQHIRGGNSYRTIYRGHTHRHACAYVDNDDDTYDVICRVLDLCADVSVHLTYVAFGAYRWDGVYTNKLIWRGRVCVDKHVATAWPAGDATAAVGVTGIASDHSYVGWRRHNTSDAWRWVGANNEELMTNDDMRSCLERVPGPVEFIGDSQLRYAYTALVSTVDKSATNFRLGKIRTNYTTDKYLYSFGSFTVNFEALAGFMADDRGLLPRYKVFKDGVWKMTCNDISVEGAFARWKQRELQRPSPSPLPTANQSLSTNERRRLILSFGTWDTDRVNVKYFVSRSLPGLRQFLTSIRSDSVLSKVKVIVTTIAAVKEQTYNDATHPGLHSHLRNNAMLAAANRLLAETVHAFDDVSLVDWFAMTVSRPLEAIDGTHYLNSDGTINNVGWSMAKLLAESICS